MVINYTEHISKLKNTRNIYSNSSPVINSIDITIKRLEEKERKQYICNCEYFDNCCTHVAHPTKKYKTSYQKPPCSSVFCPLGQSEYRKKWSLPLLLSR